MLKLRMYHVNRIIVGTKAGYRKESCLDVSIKKYRRKDLIAVIMTTAGPIKVKEINDMTKLFETLEAMLTDYYKTYSH